MHDIRSSSSRVLTTIIIILLAASRTTRAAEAWKNLNSPETVFQVGLTLDEQGRPIYRVHRSDREIIAPSRLGLVLAGDIDWTRGFQSLEFTEDDVRDETWTPVWGERSTIRDRYRSATVTIRRRDTSAQLKLEVRAYDEGIALRYVIESLPGNREIRIHREETQFRFSRDHDLWAVYSAQGKYQKVRLSEIKHSVERPCVLEATDGTVIAIAEAALVDYARMRLRRSEDQVHTLVSKLHGPVVSTLPLKTPWRVVMAADSAGALLENNDLLLNLNEPCKIANTDWIKPGKLIREVTLSTNGGKSCVDFAVENGLQFIELDAGWYGNERDDASDARTVSRPNLNLPEVIRYAKERDIGVVLYVNRRHLERDLDDLLPLYQSWGIAGLKFGFVRHGDQQWTRWMHEAIVKAAEHKLMVDVHDEYRMTGWQRTFPNFMTAEGIGGDETRPSNEQALTNLFTRMIAAPADHTFCYFNGYVDQTTSHASQLAKTVCFFSPWQFLFWYDQPSNAQGEPELEFFKHLPTTWDETRVLHGKIGQYAVVARRRGRDWFLGCLNAGQPRTLQVPLDFLPKESKFEAHIHRDDATVKTRTKVGIERRKVDSTTVLAATMSARGGVAVRIVPASAATEFVHPGVLHSAAEIALVKSKIEAGESPWKEAWETLREHALSRLDHTPRPRADIVRGAYNNPNIGAGAFMEDAAVCYTHALQWCLTGNEKHAQKAIEFLNAYARTLKSIGGHDARLLIGMVGIKFVNAAEIIRHTYDGWADADQQEFEEFIRNVLYPVIESFYPSANGNWDASMIQTMMAMGVFLDDRTIFDRGVNYFLRGEGNGAIGNYLNEFGECQESGRDQSHTQMGLGYLGCAAEIGWKQGIDLYAALDNRLLVGFEYTAKYNLGHDVPYAPFRSFQGRYHYKNISEKGRGGFMNIYERVYHHYHDRRGMETPFTKQVIERTRPEQWRNAFTSWGTLMCAELPDDLQ